MKILAQESSLLGKMVSNAKEAAPAFVASWLERADAALFSGLKKEAFGGGRRFTIKRTVVTTAGAVAFKRSHCRDESTGRCCEMHPI